MQVSKPMNTDDALSFLRQHQPMPADEKMSDEEVEQYAMVRRYLHAHPTAECIPLLLNSFGKGDGYGQYQLVENIMRQFPKEVVLPHLLEALGSPHPGVREWCAEIAAEFPDPALIQPLATLLNDPDDNTRTASAIAMAQIPCADAIMILQTAIIHEHDDDVKAFIQSLLSELSASRS